MAFIDHQIEDACGIGGRLSATEALITRLGADVVATWRDEHGATALHEAVYWSYCSDILSALITAGVDVTVASTRGITALHWAETADQVRVLTAAGALVSARTLKGATPLHIACAKLKPHSFLTVYTTHTQIHLTETII